MFSNRSTYATTLCIYLIGFCIPYVSGEIRKISTSDNILFYNTGSFQNVKPIEPYKTYKEPIFKKVTERSANSELPIDCSQRQKLKNQPIRDQYSRLRKCCPIGEAVNLLPQIQNADLCISKSANSTFNPNIINAVLYDNCIEDSEILTDNSTLPLQIGNPCNTSFLYNDNEDLLFVLHDGSLLIMDINANTSYSVEYMYCLDIDNMIGNTIAFICTASVDENVKRSHIMIVAIPILISVPCLLFIAYLHIILKEFRTLHGVSLSLMSLCLAILYVAHSVIYIFNWKSDIVGYFVQFFTLSYFFWFLCLCSNVLINVWLIATLKTKSTKYVIYCQFGIYCITSFISSLMIIIFTAQNGQLGMSSYIFKDYIEPSREPQRSFIYAVSFVLFLSLIAMMISFAGLRITQKMMASIKKDFSYPCRTEYAISVSRQYEEIKVDAKCTYLLGIVLTFTWLSGIVISYSSGHEDYVIYMDIINGFQGLFITLIFLVATKRRNIVLRWWFDRGSRDIESIELNAIDN